MDDKSSSSIALTDFTRAMGRILKNVLFVLAVSLIVVLLLRWHTTKYLRVLTSVGGPRADQISSDMIYIRHLTRNSCLGLAPSLETIRPKCPPAYTLNTTEDYSKFLDRPQISELSNKSRSVYTEKVLILTPVSNSAERLPHYFQLLCSLSYPHHLISVALGEDTSTDKTYRIAKLHAQKLEAHFRKVSVFRSAEDLRQRPVYTRHDPGFQRIRRRHLAHARNQLMMHGLSDEDWVLWIDSDVKYVPPDLIQHLLSAEKDIVAPSCMYTAASGLPDVYDRNTWRDTNQSKAFLGKVGKDFLMLEGYEVSKRQYLPAIKDEGNVVRIDGVGGCTLLVRAVCHRKGLVFPPFIFDNHIETEGLAKMAKQMGFEIFGLPHVWVLHD